MTFKLAIVATAALAITSCGDPNIRNLAPNPDPAEMVEVGDGSAVCPTEGIITDFNDYLNNAPDEMEDAAKWHETNGKRKFVKTLESGLQYQIHQKGNTAGPSPVGPQVIRAHYHGYFPDGKVFDSSYKRNEPLEYNANAFIKGWNEALSMMKPCDAWTLYVPGNIAYGPQVRPGIPPNATLVFNMQLLEVK